MSSLDSINETMDEKRYDRYIYNVLDKYASAGVRDQSELTNIAYKYSKELDIPSEDLRDYTKKTGDIDLAAIAVMNEMNFSEALKRLPNCLELTDCDIPINTAVSTYTRLLENRDRMMVILRYLVEDRFAKEDDSPITLERNVFYNILLRKDMEPTTEETTLSSIERNFVTALVSVIESDREQDIEEVLTCDEAASLVLMIKNGDIKEAVQRIYKTLGNSGNGYISFDKKTLQVLLNLLDKKKVSKAFNTELFKAIITNNIIKTNTEEKGLTFQK